MVPALFIKKNWKPITGGAIVLVIILVLRKYVFASHNASDDVAMIGSDPNLPQSTLSVAEARTTAERLFETMRYGGTDEDSLMALLSGLSYNDYVKVEHAFGHRSYVSATGSHPAFDWMGELLPLNKWLINELNLSEISELRAVLPNIFI